jgi:hypothetical protein
MKKGNFLGILSFCLSMFSLSANETYSSSQAANEENNFLVDLEFLGWFTRQQGNTYTFSGQRTDGSTDPVPAGEVYDPSFSFSPGFRVMGRGTAGEDRWNGSIGYSFLISDKIDQAGNVASADVYVPVFSLNAFGNPADGIYAYESTCKNQFFFNVIDLTLGKELDISKKIQFNGLIGLKLAYIKQDMIAKYFFVDGSYNSTLTYHQKYYGIGLKTGMETKWKFAQNYGLYFDGAFSLMWDHTKAHAIDKYTLPWENFTDIDQTYTAHALNPVFELAIGLWAQWKISKSGSLIRLKAGWEEQAWLYMNQHSSVIADTSLLMQGATVKMQFEF